MNLPINAVQEIVRRALAEDIASGDITTRATVGPEKRGQAAIFSKAEGYVAGLPVAKEVLLALDPTLEFTTIVWDGARITPGLKLAAISGRIAPILTAERTLLNLLMRMSGIATLTARFVAAVAGTRAKIVDTRKTAPGLRLLDKYAVNMGGGQNHRFGLYDGIIIKENHITAAGGIAEAVARVRESAHHLLKIEVEATTLEEVEQALSAGADAILFDNMRVEMMAEAVKLVAGRALCEASGGITLESVRAVAETGVDLISVGRLTHSAPALDISLEVL